MKWHLLHCGIRNMHGIYFYSIGIAFTSGIFIRSFFYVGWPEIACMMMTGIACGVAFMVQGRKKVKDFLSPLFLIALTLICFVLGIIRMQSVRTEISPLAPYVDTNVSLTARIVREPEIRESTINLTVLTSVKTESNTELILVSVDRFASVSETLSYGDTLQIDGKLSPPKTFDTDGGRVFDYPGYLKARGISYVIPRAKVKIDTEETGTFMGYLFQYKKVFQESLEQSIPEPYAGLGEGVLLGVKRALGKDLEDAFRRTGIIHIVVLSGYNIMIVVESIMFALSFFFFPRTRLILGILTISVFALMVGLSATVLRASLMAVLLLIARTTGRTYAVLRALTLAGVGMLILNPYLLVHDPGFQLSFLATLGLILLAPHIKKHLTRIPELWGIRGFLTATLATQLFVLPLLLYQMGILSLVSVIVNVLVLPIVPLAMLFTFLSGVAGLLFSTLGILFGFLAYLSLGYIIFVAQLFDSLSFASVTIQTFPFWIVLVMYALYVFALVYMYTKEESVVLDEAKDEYDDWTFEDENPLTSVQKVVCKDNSFPFR